MSAEWVLRRMADAGIGHDDVVAAVGGGVVGDLGASARRCTSAASATCRCPRRSWRRSTPPTAARPAWTFPEGKNYAGAYHQPSAVLVDPSALDTLPAAERAAGYAEVVKTALIAGGPLWARVRDGRDPDDESSSAACARSWPWWPRTSATAGRRQVLNLGHTVGHAIEAATGLRALPPRGGGRDRPAGGAAALRARRAAQGGGGPAGRARAAARSPAPIRRPSWNSWPATRSGAATRPVRARAGARRGDPRPRGGRADLLAAVEEVHAG